MVSQTIYLGFRCAGCTAHVAVYTFTRRDGEWHANRSVGDFFVACPDCTTSRFVSISDVEYLKRWPAEAHRTARGIVMRTHAHGSPAQHHHAR